MSTDESKKHLETEGVLARQLRFEQAVAKVSKCLVGAQSPERAVPEALTSLLEASQVARVYIFENFEDADDGLCMKQLYEVCAPGITPEIDNPILQHVVYADGFERWREALASGLNIRGYISNFPDDEREILEPQGILSILVLPIVVEGKWWGFVGFDETRNRRNWQDSEVALLGTTAEMLGSYFSRQQVQERLERVAAELKLAQRISKVGNWFLDPKVGVPQWSEEVFRIYERNPDLGPIPLIDFHKIYSSEQFEIFNSTISEAIENGTPYNIELHLQLPSGTEKWVNAICEPFPENGSAGHCLLGTIQDITEKKKNEEALRESEDFLNKTGDMAKVGGWEVDLEAQRVFWTRTTARIHELPDDYYPDLEEAINFYHPEDRDHVRQCVQRAIESGESYDFTVRLITAKGQERWVRALGLPLFDSGKCVRLSGTFQDITESKQKDEERERLSTQLQHAQKMEAIGRLAGGVAHDFNNMLGIIIGYSDTLLEEMDPEHPFHEALSEIREAGKRSAELTKQLLAFARKQTVLPKILNLNETVSDMLKMLERLIGEDIEVSWVPDEKLWPVKVDPGQIDQVLANLCVNARDAISDIGKVTIETGNARIDADRCSDQEVAPGDYVLLAVSDNGCGMDAEALAQVFEPFYTTKEFGKGTGLGLSTVYGIVKQNKGFIEAYSERGQGTTFKMYLPRYQTKVLPTSDKDSKSPVKRGHETILLVEDEQTILKLAIHLLRQEGYTVLGADSPIEAIRLATEHPEDIHLLVTDVVMPEMNGRDLANKVLSLYPAVKCLFMSGYTADVIAHHGVLDDGVNFIQKPFLKSELTVKVRNVLDSE